MQLIGVVFGILGLVCSIIILVNAFQKAIWKGLLCFFCWFYLLWFAIFEFEHDHKWWIVVGMLLFGGTGAGLSMSNR